MNLLQQTLNIQGEILKDLGIEHHVLKLNNEQQGNIDDLTELRNRLQKALADIITKVEPKLDNIQLTKEQKEERTERKLQVETNKLVEIKLEKSIQSISAAIHLLTDEWIDLTDYRQRAKTNIQYS